MFVLRGASWSNVVSGRVWSRDPSASSGLVLVWVSGGKVVSDEDEDAAAACLAACAASNLSTKTSSAVMAALLAVSGSTCLSNGRINNKLNKPSLAPHFILTASVMAIKVPIFVKLRRQLNKGAPNSFPTR